MVRGHFAYDDQFGNDHSISLIAGAELRGSKSNSLYSKRYGYDAITGNTITPLPSTTEGIGYAQLKEYLAALDASTGETWNEQRFASFYASADYYYKNKYVLNASFSALMVVPILVVINNSIQTGRQVLRGISAKKTLCNLSNRY